LRSSWWRIMELKIPHTLLGKRMHHVWALLQFQTDSSSCHRICKFFFVSVPGRYPQAPVYGFKKKVRCNAKADWN
jgi:hypothetical protein